MKETRPLILRTTTQEEVRLHKTGKRGTGGKEGKERERERERLENERGDSWWMNYDSTCPIHSYGACGWLLMVLFKPLSSFHWGQQGYSTWLHCQTHRLLEYARRWKLRTSLDEHAHKLLQEAEAELDEILSALDIVPSDTIARFPDFQKNHNSVILETQRA